jgi:hypothetical protein
MFSIGVSINPTLIDKKIAEIELICENILEMRNEIKDINDDYTEGIYYSKYLEGISAIGGIMDSSEKAIRGYINFLHYVKNNYLTMDKDLANALKTFDIVK